MKNKLHSKTPAQHPTHDEVARRAFAIFLERGGVHGHNVEDWLQAERELARLYRKSDDDQADDLPLGLRLLK